MRALLRLALALVFVFAASNAARSQNPCLLDGFCTFGETCENCKQDCCPDTYCGDSICQPGESSWCQIDCDLVTCGDGICEAHEDGVTCPQDCNQSQCGNGWCDDNEDSNSCPEDCSFICGDGVCEWGEERECPFDCWARRPPSPEER